MSEDNSDLVSILKELRKTIVIIAVVGGLLAAAGIYFSQDSSSSSGSANRLLEEQKVERESDLCLRTFGANVTDRRQALDDAQGSLGIAGTKLDSAQGQAAIAQGEGVRGFATDDEALVLTAIDLFDNAKRECAKASAEVEEATKSVNEARVFYAAANNEYQKVVSLAKEDLTAYRQACKTGPTDY